MAGRVYLRHQPGQRAGSKSELQGNHRSQVLAKVREETRWVSQAGSAGHDGLHLVLFEARSKLGSWFPRLSSPSSSDDHGPGLHRSTACSAE